MLTIWVRCLLGGRVFFKYHRMMLKKGDEGGGLKKGQRNASQKKKSLTLRNPV